MQKNTEEKEWSRIVSDIRIGFASDLLDCDQYVLIMQHPTQGLLQCSSSKSDARVLIDKVKDHYK